MVTADNNIMIKPLKLYLLSVNVFQPQPSDCNKLTDWNAISNIVLINKNVRFIVWDLPGTFHRS